MAYTDASGTVITQAGELLHKSFNRLSGTIQSTQVTFYASNATSATNGTNTVAADDYFGYSVAVRSGIIAVGAPFQDSGGSAAGAVYIHNLDGTGRGRYGNARFFGVSDSSGDNFGHTVAVGSGSVVFGGPEDGASRGSINIMEADDIERNGNGTRVQYGAGVSGITGSGTSNYDKFGYSVAVGSGIIVVGSPTDAPYLQVYGTYQNDTGAAYIFNMKGKEPATNSAYGRQISFYSHAARSPANDLFGTSVAAGCGRIVVGAPSNGVTNQPGRAYIYDLDGNLITEIQAREFDETDGTESSDDAPNARFGFSVAVGSGRIVVGAPLHADGSVATTRFGAAYVYDLNGKFIQKLLAATSSASDTAQDDYFGFSVAAGCGRIVVGAPLNDDAGVGTNSGSAYVYDLDGTIIEKLVDNNNIFYIDTNANFGWAVAIGSGKIVIGAPGTKFLANDNIGSAHIFDVDENYDTYIERQLGY